MRWYGSIGKDYGYQVDNLNFIIKKFSIFYSDLEFSDLRFCIGERIFYVYKFIFSIFSDVFKIMLIFFIWLEVYISEILLEEELEC